MSQKIAAAAEQTSWKVERDIYKLWNSQIKSVFIKKNFFWVWLCKLQQQLFFLIGSNHCFCPNLKWPLLWSWRKYKSFVLIKFCKGMYFSHHITHKLQVANSWCTSVCSFHVPLFLQLCLEQALQVVLHVVVVSESQVVGYHMH